MSSRALPSARRALFRASSLLALLALPASADEPATDADALDDATRLAIVQALVKPADAANLLKRSPEDQSRKTSQILGELKPEARRLLLARARYAAEHFREATTEPVLTHRGIVLLRVGAPTRVHEEQAREWSESVPRLDSAAEVIAFVDPEDEARGRSLPGGEPLPLAGPLPTQAWVLETERAGKVRVLWFVDEDRDGSWRLVKDEERGSADPISPAPPQELPAELFAQVGAGEKFDPLRPLKQDLLGLEVVTSHFKAAEAKTFVRFLVTLRPADVDIELDLPAATYLSKAEVWLQVEQGGAPLFQASRAGSAASPTADPMLFEFGVPLLPGDYGFTALVVDDQGRGGQRKGTITVPALSGGLSLSSLVLARAEKVGDDVGLPKAVAPAEGELAPFQVGSYVVEPVLGAFHVGDTLAVVVQIYNAAGTTLEYDVWREGSRQGGLDELVVDRVPATEIQLIPIVDGWTDGSYKIVVTATDPKEPSSKVVREATFRVKG